VSPTDVRPADERPAEEAAAGVDRYVPRVPLPAAAFVPGRAGAVRPSGETLVVSGHTLPPESWGENEAWLFGADLWNHGFLWEAHEVWERLWRAPFDARQAEFLRGLIQCAAAGLKVAVGDRDAATSLADKGTLRIETVAVTRYMGLDALAFAAQFRAWARSGSHPPDVLPRIVLAD